MRSVPVKKKRLCKNCMSLPEVPASGPEEGVEYRPRTPRPAPHPGPRCDTCNRLKKKRDKERNHERRVVLVYGISPGDYARLYEAQGGVCYICRLANGRTKKLAVDHNHDTGEVRGLLCGPCNKGVIGHLRHNPEALQRAIDYLLNPPARRVLIAAS